MFLKKISDKVWLTEKGIVDLNAKPELTPAQQLSNFMLDFEIMMANQHNDFVKEQNRLKIERWKAPERAS